MGFLQTFVEVMTSKPISLREPVFLKEFREDNKQLDDLEELMKIAPEETRKQIEEDRKLLSYGIVGERNVAYELKNSHMPILVLHDLFLEYNNLSAQIDFIVISRKFILVIECKNLVGDISITNEGQFVRYFKGQNGKVYKKEGMYSPITQNERHVALIKDILKHEKSFNENGLKLIKHIVVVANPRSIINSKHASKEIRQQIIKCDQLINKMQELYDGNKDGYWCTEETMYRVANDLLMYNGKYKVDYEEKYGVSLPNIDNLYNETKENSMGEKDCIKNKEIQVESEKAFKKKERFEPIEENKLYKELKKYRLDKSKEEHCKAFLLYNDLQLKALVNAKPKTIEELKVINGFGAVKCEKYGQDIIKIVKKNL